MLLLAVTTIDSLLAANTSIGVSAPILGLANYNVSWALVLFSVILGLLVTLSSSRRTAEIKRPKDD